MRRTTCIAALLLMAACGRKEAAAPAETTTSTTTTATATAQSSAAQPSAAAGAEEKSLVSFSSGALIVQKPAEYDEGWSAFRMLDEKPDTGWATPENNVSPQSTVIALPERTELTRVEFDTASVDGDGRGAKDVVVEVSDQSAAAGFQQAAAVQLQDRQDKQSFPLSAPATGRWVRLTVKNNHGSTQYTELMDFRAYGRQLTTTPFTNISGTYETNYGPMHIRQEGTSVTGCYEHDNGLLNGGIEGRVMKLTWSEGDGKQQNGDRGPAVMVFTPDAKTLFGLWWNEGQESAAGGDWNGQKSSSDVGTCPHWSGGAAAQMTKELEEAGRTRVYGINFDVDSATIRSESKPTLDKIVAVLKAKSDWKLTIEGHTDASGSEEHNQTLSEQRAASVKSYLTTAGIEESRLTTSGFGATRPVAPNTTELGKAQNRRVELVRAGA